MRAKIFLGSLFLGLSLVACAGKMPSKVPFIKSSSGHPALSAEEKLMSCADCHQNVTPEIYQEWFKSRHGIANVKCFQCHGTYENFSVEPSPDSCASCHAQEVAHSPKDKPCWACHFAHKFSVHK